MVDSQCDKIISKTLYTTRLVGCDRVYRVVACLPLSTWHLGTMQTLLSVWLIMPHLSYGLQSDNFLQGKLLQNLNIFGHVRIKFQWTEKSSDLVMIRYYFCG